MKKENSQIRLKKIMEERGLRQVDILEKSKPFQKQLGVTMSKTHLSNYINGKSNPDQSKLVLLSKTLGVSEPWLMGYDVPRNDSDVSSNNEPIIEETVKTMKKLEEPRQQIVLDTANTQLKEQEEAQKIKKLEDYRLSDEFLDEQISKASAYGGKPLSDNDKEFFKQLLKKTMEERIERGE